MKTIETGISANTKQAMIELLNARLADSIDLALAVKQAHWNLRGPTFIAVHELLDQVRADLDENVDIVAERVSQLDGLAQGTADTVAEKSALEPYPTDIRKITDHLNALVERFAAVATSVREAIDTADEAGDADTTDIFTAYSRALDKNLWFLKAHLD